MPLTDLLARAPSTCECPHYTPRSLRRGCVDLLDSQACARPEYFLCDDPRAIERNLHTIAPALDAPQLASPRTLVQQFSNELSSSTPGAALTSPIDRAPGEVASPTQEASDFVEVYLRTEHGDVVLVPERTRSNRLEVTFEEATVVHNFVSMMGGSVVSIQRRGNSETQCPAPSTPRVNTTESNRDAQQLLFTPQQLKPSR